MGIQRRDTYPHLVQAKQKGGSLFHREVAAIVHLGMPKRVGVTRLGALSHNPERSARLLRPPSVVVENGDANAVIG